MRSFDLPNLAKSCLATLAYAIFCAVMVYLALLLLTDLNLLPADFFDGND